MNRPGLRSLREYRQLTRHRPSGDRRRPARAELAPAVQAKLRRVLQEPEVERVGGVRPIPIDVQSVAATNQKLRALVDERRFRADLYFRLKVVTVTISPLRDRPRIYCRWRSIFSSCTRDASAR